MGSLLSVRLLRTIRRKPPHAPPSAGMSDTSPAREPASPRQFNQPQKSARQTCQKDAPNEILEMLQDSSTDTIIKEMESIRHELAVAYKEIQNAVRFLFVNLGHFTGARRRRMGYKGHPLLTRRQAQSSAA